MDINLTLIGEMGTFLVLWWFVNKYIWPVFNRAVEERLKKVSEGLNLSDKARHELENAEQETTKIVNQAKMQAADIVGRAQKQAEQIIIEARTEAQNVGKREINVIRENFEQEKRKIREELRNQLTDLVIRGVRQVIEREVKADDHAHLLRELSEKL